jgi:acetolactate synthase-1/2/3 large subunit
MARALGLHGERVEKPEDLPGALKRALANTPALIDVVTSQTVLSSDAKKGLGTVHDFQALEAWNTAELKRRGQS